MLPHPLVGNGKEAAAWKVLLGGLFRPAPPLFIVYVKACVRMSDPCNEGLEARAAEKADSLGTRGFYRPAIFPHSLPKA